jgi:two-component system nitrate/nitrite sensor histidine kinase NarX
MTSTPSTLTALQRSTPEDPSVVVSCLTSALAAGAELEPLLQRFLVSIVALAGAQAGAVRVLTDDGRYMRLVAQQGLPEQVLSTERLVERSCGMCGVAASSDVLVWVDDVRSCARHGKDAYFGARCQRVLAISLAHGSEVLGIYNLFFEAGVQLPAQTETILRLIGQLLGLALHNARIERERLRMTVMKERQDMVNEVHDAIAQTLAYVKMRLPLLNDAMLAHDDTRSLKYFSDVKKAVGEVHDNLREVMTYFRTRMDPLGLLHALQGIADGFLDRTGIALEISNQVQNLNMSDEQEVQVFYIVQEALANIAKHSRATHALVAIEMTAQGWEFVVEDDGLGLSPLPAAGTPERATHLGLEIMQGRAQRLGATLDVGRSEGGGTRVRLRVPRAVQELAA